MNHDGAGIKLMLDEKLNKIVSDRKDIVPKYIILDDNDFEAVLFEHREALIQHGINIDNKDAIVSFKYNNDVCTVTIIKASITLNLRNTNYFDNATGDRIESIGLLVLQEQINELEEVRFGDKSKLAKGIAEKQILYLNKIKGNILDRLKVYQNGTK